MNYGTYVFINSHTDYISHLTKQDIKNAFNAMMSGQKNEIWLNGMYDLAVEFPTKTLDYAIARTYADGVVVAKQEYRNLMIHRVEVYYPDGKIERECSYKNGKRHGKCIVRYGNRDKNLEADFCHGLLHGDVAYYNAVGIEYLREKYDKGVEICQQSKHNQNTGKIKQYLKWSHIGTVLRRLKEAYGWQKR